MADTSGHCSPCPVHRISEEKHQWKNQFWGERGWFNTKPWILNPRRRQLVWNPGQTWNHPNTHAHDLTYNSSQTHNCPYTQISMVAPTAVGQYVGKVSPLSFATLPPALKTPIPVDWCSVPAPPIHLSSTEASCCKNRMMRPRSPASEEVEAQQHPLSLDNLVGPMAMPRK